MKMTIEIPNGLFRRLKREAKVRGCSLRALIEEALPILLKSPRGMSQRHSLAELMKDARGCIDSGLPDLASNPEHLRSFGNDR